MRKLFAIVMSMLMIACFMPTMAFAGETPTKTWEANGKFKVGLTSGATTATAEVYDDYSVSAKVVGDTVDAASVKIVANMKNVASLGVKNERSHTINLNTGIQNKKDISLPAFFPHIFGCTTPSDFITSEENVTPFNGATITGTIDDKPYDYEISAFAKAGSKENDKDVYTLTATPKNEDNVRAAWHQLTSYVATSTAADNSKIVLKDGTEIRVGTCEIKLKGSDCTIDPSNGGIAMDEEKGSISGSTTEEVKGQPEISVYLPEGTVLQLGGTVATLNRGLYVFSNIKVSSDVISGIEQDLKLTDAQTKKIELVKNLVKLVDSTVASIDTATDPYINILGEYKVTVETQDGKDKEIVSYAYGDTIDLPTAPVVSGKTFDKWVIKDTETKVDETYKVTEDVTIVPVYKAASSGGSSGGYVAPVTPTTDNVTNTTEDKKTDTSAGAGTTVATTTATVKAETKTAADGTKTVAATVDPTTATKIVEKAVENKSEEVVVNTATTAAVTETAAGTTTKVDLPEQTVKAIAEKTEAAVTIKSDAAEIKLDTEAVKAVAEQAGDTGTVNLVVETVAQNETKVEVNLKLVTSKGDVSDFKGGNVSVTVKLNTKLAAKPVVCVYIDDNGTYHKVKGVKNADGTFTFTTGHFSSYAVMEEEEANKVIAEQTAKVEKMVKALSLKARSAKTEKGNIKVTLKVDSDAIKAIEDLGYTVKYKFYRSAKKAKGYKAATEKTGKTYTNTTGKKGTKYYYKARVMVYDAQGELIAKTALKQCKYASRTR